MSTSNPNNISMTRNKTVYHSSADSDEEEQQMLRKTNSFDNENALAKSLLSLNKSPAPKPTNPSELKSYPDHLEILKETRTYVFFGPTKKDESHQFYKAVYSKSKNFRIEEGYKVILEGSTSDSVLVWNVIFIGQAANRHVWVWLHKPESGDILMRPLSEVVDVNGKALPEEMIDGIMRVKEKEGISFTTPSKTGSTSIAPIKTKRVLDSNESSTKKYKVELPNAPPMDEPFWNTFSQFNSQMTNANRPDSPGAQPYGSPNFYTDSSMHHLNNYAFGMTNSPPLLPQLSPFIHMQAPPVHQFHAPIDKDWRKYVRGHLIQMIHDLDNLEAQEDTTDHQKSYPM